MDSAYIRFFFRLRTINQREHRLMGAGFVTGEHLRRNRPLEKRLPERAARLRRDGRFHGAAITVGEIGERAQPRRQQRLDVSAQPLAQHRGGASR